MGERGGGERGRKERGGFRKIGGGGEGEGEKWGRREREME